MKSLLGVLFILLPTMVNASDMAGVGLVISLPITVVLLVITTLIALMSSTGSGYKYIFIAVGIALLIAIPLAGYSWNLTDDINNYKWHLLLTGLMVLPPLALKIKLRSCPKITYRLKVGINSNEET
jgi:uncharacterized membrane protein